VAEFLTLDQSALLASLSARHERVMGMRPDGLQIAAWCGEYEILGVTLREIVASVPRAREWAVIFEYELPRERGRRPDVVILTGSGKDSWALMVGLIGEGQEIYLGEEAGRLRLLKAEASASGAHWAAQYVVLGRVRSTPATPAPCVLVLRVPIAPRRRNPGLQQPRAQWNDAIARTSDSWTVHCPRKIGDILDSADRLEISESLDLDMSLRTHLAEDVQGWVQDLLEGRLDAAAAHAEAMEKQGFRLYLTRELERATGYVRERVAA